MSDTDIYKNREPMPMGGNRPPKKPRRRRRSSQRAFDETGSRKRRSKNSGFRRVIHLFRKSENEKMVWGSIGFVTLVILIGIAVWQFVVLEQIAREKDAEDDYMNEHRSIPQASESLIKSPTE